MLFKVVSQLSTVALADNVARRSVMFWKALLHATAVVIAAVLCCSVFIGSSRVAARRL